MSDVPGAVLEAVVSALKAGVPGADVYGVAPDKAQPPFLLVRSIQWDEIGSKTSRAYRCQLSLMTFAGGTSKKALFDLRALAVAALDGQPLAGGVGVLIGDSRHLSGSDERETDENLLMAVDEFQIFAQPA